MWIVCDGDGFAHASGEGLVYPEEGDRFYEKEEAEHEAERLNIKYDTTSDWYRAVDFTTNANA